MLASSLTIQVVVSLGNKLPADLRFVDASSDLKLDRSVLTGESEPIAASIESTDDNILETRNIGLQGTLCVSGSGKGQSTCRLPLRFVKVINPAS